MAFITTGLTNAGVTTRFIVKYEDTLGADGIRMGNLLIPHIENDYDTLKGYFGGIDFQPPFTNPEEIRILYSETDGGATWVYPPTSPSHIDLSPIKTTTDHRSVRWLVNVELVEHFAFKQLKGWFYNYDLLHGGNEGGAGEAISIFLGFELEKAEFPGTVVPASPATPATRAWLLSERADFVNNGGPTASNYIEYGCGILFLSYLKYQLGYTVEQIVAAAPGVSAYKNVLREVYRALTSDNGDPFPAFRALLDSNYPIGTSAPPSVMWQPFPLTIQGTGSERTYVSANPAYAIVDADVRLRVEAGKPADTVDGFVLTEHWASFDSEDFIVHEGIPNGRPKCEVRLRTRVGLERWQYSDVPPAPLDVNTGATLRWLPTPSSVTPSGWTPAIGGGLSLVSQLGQAPYFDDRYSFEVRGGDEVNLPAVIFEEDSWLRMNNQGWSATAFTVAVAAVLHPSPGSPYYGVFESYVAPTPSPVGDADTTDPGFTPQNWGVRYRQGTLEFWAGGVVVSHDVLSPLGRPVIIAMSMSTEGGNLLIVDRTTSTRSLSTDGIEIFNAQLYLGRTGDDEYAAGQGAVMDVLEVDFYDHALSFSELAELAHELDSVYGVTG